MAACATKAPPHHDTRRVLDIHSVPLLVSVGGAGPPDLHGPGVDDPKHRLVTKHDSLPVFLCPAGASWQPTKKEGPASSGTPFEWFSQQCSTSRAPLS
jgi:hypothetical protein